MDLCRTSIDKIPNIFGRIMKTLYSRFDENGGMDFQSINRLSELFSYHLSNFGFSWRWSDWESAVELPPTSSKFIFIRETIERLIRLSYYDRIKNSIPESFEGRLFSATAPTHYFEYASIESCPDPVLVQYAADLISAISARDSEDDIRMILAKVDLHSGETDPMADSEILTRNVLMNCIMHQGSKSFSHILNVIEKYLTLLQSMNETPEARSHTVLHVFSFWASNTQFLEIILDKFVNYRIVDPRSILSHVVTVPVLEEFGTRHFITSIVNNTLSKVNLKAQQIELKLDAARLSDHAAVQNLTTAHESSLREKKETLILAFNVYFILPRISSNVSLRLKTRLVQFMGLRLDCLKRLADGSRLMWTG